MPPEPLDMPADYYRAAGVDRRAAQKAIDLIKGHARTTFNPAVLSDIGFFGSLYHLKGYRDPVLVSSTDGVGTKVRVASLLGRYETVGADLINLNVNDIVVAGARPLFFLDYMAMGRLDPDKAGALAQGMASACREIGCALVGGETAEMPGIYRDEDFDLVGFVVGAAERDQIIDGSSIKVGDIILGMASSGVHSNGLSLVRRVFDIEEDRASLDAFYPALDRTLGEELLQVHSCYYLPLRDWFPYIKGMAHITGGGLVENVPRILPRGTAAKMDPATWKIHPIFALIQTRGHVPIEEMYRVFNMGLGMVMVTSRQNIDTLTRGIPGARVVGEIVAQEDDRRVLL